MKTLQLLPVLGATLLACGSNCADAYTVYVSNEKGNSLTVIDSETLQVLTTIPVGQRPRGIMLTKDGKRVLICASDDDTVQVLDVASREVVADLPSGPDPELLDIHPSGSPVYIANEDDNLLTGGLIDSLGMMRLVDFIEQNFDLRVRPEDVTIENFRTISAIATYIRHHNGVVVDG